MNGELSFFALIEFHNSGIPLGQYIAVYIISWPIPLCHVVACIISYDHVHYVMVSHYIMLQCSFHHVTTCIMSCDHVHYVIELHYIMLPLALYHVIMFMMLLHCIVSYVCGILLYDSVNLIYVVHIMLYEDPIM